MHGWMLTIAHTGYQGTREGDAEFRRLDLPPLFQTPVSASKAFVRPPREADVSLEDESMKADYRL